MRIALLRTHVGDLDLLRAEGKGAKLGIDSRVYRDLSDRRSIVGAFISVSTVQRVALMQLMHRIKAIVTEK